MRDIADDKKAEEALWDSETCYRRLFETAQDGILILDAETGMIVDVNPFLVGLLGFSHEQLAGKAIWDIGPFKDIASNREKFMELQRQEYVRYENLPLETADGRRIDVEFVSNVYDVDHSKVIQCNIRDITDRKKAEEALRESENRYRRLFETAQDGILLLDTETGMITDVNPFLIEMLGFSHEQFVGKAIWEIGLFKDVASNKDKFMELQRQGYVRYEDLPLETADGRWIDVEFISNVYAVDDRKVIQCNIRDITDRRRAEDALRKSEEQYHTTFENTGTATVLIDEDTIISLANAEFERISGYSKNEIEGKKSWTDFVVKEDLDQMLAQHRLRREDREAALRQYEFRFAARSGEIHFILLSIDVIPGTKRSIASLQDITERKRAEEAQRASEVRYRRLFETAQDGILLLNAETGTIADVNPFLVDLLGFSHKQLVGRAIWEIGLFKDIAANKDKFMELQRQGYVRYEDLPLETADGRRIDVEFVSNVYDVDHSQVIQCNIRNISDRKRVEGELRKIEWLLKPKDAFKEAFVQSYGDISQNNTDRTILDALGPEPLHNIMNEFMSLLETSSAVYEKNGDYAAGISSSGWCHFLEQASFKLCNTDRIEQALNCGKWHCHESCWSEAARKAIESGAPIDTRCAGGIRLYAIPIRIGDEIIGAINFGYGNPPDSREELNEIAARYQVSTEELTRLAGEYRTRPQFIIDLAKRRLANAADLIALMVERKRAEEALRVSELRYRRLFETAKDGILILDATGKIIDVNPFLIELSGFSYDEFLGKAIWDIGSLKDIASNRDKFVELQRQGYVRYENLPLETADGRRIDVEFVSNVYDVDHSQVIQCNIRDISERKRAEEEIASRLRETIRMKLDFISMVSHEMRTPLTVIKEGIALIANGSTGDIKEEQRELLDLSKKNVDRLAKFINEVLDFQKLEAGRSSINARPNDINETVRDVCDMMALAVNNAGVDIVLELDDKLPLIGFDADKIAQVLTNLVDNAVKFTEKGRIVIRTTQKDGMIHVSVSDTGCGIRKEDLPRSFRMFEHLSSGGDRRKGGTGLGLAICKGLVEQHNGRIWVDSIFGKGSEFTFTLPIRSLTELFRKYIDDGIKEAATNNTRMSLLLISTANLPGSPQELSHDDVTSRLKGMEAVLAKNLHRRNGRPNQATDAVFSFPDKLFIVLTNCGKEDAHVVEERLRQRLNEYLAGKHLADKIALCFECVTYPEDAATSEELIEQAEKAHPVVSMALSVQ